MQVFPMLLYISICMVTPGPNNLMTLYLGGTLGLWGSRYYILGSACSITAKILLCGGLNILISEWVPVLLPYLKWGGVIYLAYLGCSIIWSGWKARVTGEQVKGMAGISATFAGGVLLQALNMKSWVFALSVFSIYVIPYTASYLPVLGVALFGIVVFFGCALLWGGGGQLAGGIFRRYPFASHLVLGLMQLYCAVTAAL